MKLEIKISQLFIILQDNMDSTVKPYPRIFTSEKEAHDTAVDLHFKDTKAYSCFINDTN